MKNNPKNQAGILKVILVLAFLAYTFCATQAQINPSDPQLRMWLKADVLTGTTVATWTDSSSYSTLLQVPPLPPGDTGNDLSNHTPQLITADNDGVMFNAVHFRQANDPITPDPTYGHYSDRLWQTNNLGANDPTLINASSNITMIAVFKNNVVGSGLGADQTMFAKRGPTACPFEMGFYWAGLGLPSLLYPPDYFYFSGGADAYSPQSPVPLQPEWTILEIEITADGTMTERDYYKSLGGWRTSSMTGVARGGVAEGVPFTIGFHEEGKGGSAGNPWGNGAYERFAGDIAEFALYDRSLSSNERSGIENYLLAKYFLHPGPAVITTQPQSQTVGGYESVTFSVLADGTPPFTYQWLKDGSPILGADASSYTITNVIATDAGKYSVTVGNNIGYTNSQSAVLTINGPSVVSALLDYVDNTHVKVTYSELVDMAAATDISNYNINNSVNITGAVAVMQTNEPAWNDYVYSVNLTTTPIVSQSTLTINAVKDRAGLTVSNEQAVIFVPGAVTSPPTANCLLWLAADTAVQTDSIGVYDWGDQSGSGHSTANAFGQAQLAQEDFPNAIHPVVNFDGASFFTLNNYMDFEADKITIYLVGDVDNTKTSSCWIGNWPGWALGLSDSYPGVIKWVDNTVSGVFTMSPVEHRLSNRKPVLMRATFVTAGDKTLAINDNIVGIQTNFPAHSYSGSTGMAIGSAFGTGGQNLYGSIAEILVYTNVSSAQDAAVQSYLTGKYFSPSLEAPKLMSATRNGTNDTSVTVVFSEPVTEATATNVSNYAIDHGVTVSAASINSTNVILTTSPIYAGPEYTLTVNGIGDWAGNTIATNSQTIINGIPLPRIGINVVGNSVSVTWDALDPYKLQSAASVSGPWTDVVGASNPYMVTPSQTNIFYRLSQ